MNDEQENGVLVKYYHNMDLSWYNVKPVIDFSNDKDRVSWYFGNKYLTKMTRNLIMKALLKTNELAKNADPVVLTDHIELNSIYPKKKDLFDVYITIRPDWDKNLYDIKFVHRGFDEFAPEGVTPRNIRSEYENNNITQNDLMCILHHLLPKASRHVMRRKSLENKCDYLASVSQVK